MARRRRSDAYCVILNPGARAATTEDLLAVVGQSAEVWTTTGPGDASVLARRAVEQGFATVVAAGGDGTLNEVVNGLVAARGGSPGDAASPGRAPRRSVACAVLPLGTGNDFARTLGMPLEPEAAWRTILERRTRRVDVVALERQGSARWFINMAVGGAIDQIQEKLTDDLKQRWGPLAYLRAGAEALAKLLTEIGPHQVALRLDGGGEIELEAWSVAVANGRTVGGGIAIAPQADPADGLLDVVAIRGVRGVEMAKVAAAVLLGRHLDRAEGEEASPVLFLRGRRLELRSSPPMPFTTDGEVNEGSPAVFTTHPRALEMVVGASDE
jgi:diacylglycerol kinase (ATP)